MTYRSFLKWMREASIVPMPAIPKRKPCRPKTPDEIRDLVLKIARETHWGYTRILGELKKLGITRISRQTVKNILVEHGLEPGPNRGEGSWEEFLKMHAQTLWQCDFFSKMIWTPTGLRQCFALAFIHLATRKVFVTPSTFNPKPEWMRIQAENFIDHAWEQGISAKIVTRDNDLIYTPPFDEAFRDAGIRMKLGKPVSPNLQAYIEQFVQSIQQECLDHFIILGQKHYDHLIQEYVVHYHDERPHQGLNNLPLTGLHPPRDAPPITVRCHERLGGLLKHYSRVA